MTLISNWISRLRLLPITTKNSIFNLKAGHSQPLSYNGIICWSSGLLLFYVVSPTNFLSWLKLFQGRWDIFISAGCYAWMRVWLIIHLQSLIGIPKIGRRTCYCLFLLIPWYWDTSPHIAEYKSQSFLCWIMSFVHHHHPHHSTTPNQPIDSLFFCLPLFSTLPSLFSTFPYICQDGSSLFCHSPHSYGGICPRTSPDTGRGDLLCHR